MKRVKWEEVLMRLGEALAFGLIIIGGFALCVLILEAKIRGWI